MTYRLEHMRTGSGFYERGLAGETLGARKLVYLTDVGEWKLADASAASTMPSIGLTLGAIAYGLYGNILIKGFVGDASWSWTRGSPVFASETAGELTQTIPTSNLQQIVGYAREDDLLFFTPRRGFGSDTLYYLKTEAIAVESLGRPNTNPPTVVDKDNLRLLSFTLNTDSVSIKMTRPTDWVTGAIEFSVVWTNDGNTNDNTKAVKVQMDYQTGSDGDVISGSHANSPKTTEDTYDSASGTVQHQTDYISIAQVDFENESCIYAKFSFITPAGAALTVEPHMIGICLRYNASPDR